MMLIRAIAIVLLLAVAGTACATAESALAAPSSDAPAAFDAVLIELFGTDDTEAYLAQTERSAAELVVTCMADAGFEFQISPAPAPLATPSPGDLDGARSMGFGIIAGFRHQVAQTDLEVQRGEDPNLAYLSTLSSAEIDRFFLTLDGVAPEPGQRRDNAGCNGWASDQAYADWKRFFEALPNYTAMGEERDTHPDWLAARVKWHTCMLDGGFDYLEPDAIRTDVIARMRDTVNERYPGGQVPLVLRDGAFVVDPDVDVLLDELVEFEKAAAVANVECTAPIADEFDAVEQEVQQAFVDRNQVAIDELVGVTK